jgi:hypothetical protein
MILFSTAVRAQGETLLECVLIKCRFKVKRNIVTAPIHCHFTTHARRVTDHEVCAPVIIVFLTAMFIFCVHLLTSTQHFGGRYWLRQQVHPKQQALKQW